mmetsp:Transcript_49945/g.128883  ORF Transcript_49945/g.128883 Transcript_49945/m.128883 type:complete len:742 (+) Transcript_49945:103-2328(+)
MAALRGATIAAEELLVPLSSYVLRRGCGGIATANGTAASASSSVPGDDWKFDLVRSVGEECQTEAELRGLLQRKPDFTLYDGFEPSGRMHIAQGVFKAINVNKCTKAGGTFIFWVADWFALMNDKMGGDLEKIKTVGKYFIEVWKAAGMDMSRVKFLWSSDEISNHAEQYWGQALDIARRSTLARIKKCCQIMGRGEDKLTAAQILYPIMQCTDIFFLKADICQLGVDQRKVNMLAREYCDAAGRKLKPVVLSHHMLYGLAAGQAKMSKSNPDSAIFMEDTVEDVERKIRQAYCPIKPDAAVAAKADEEELSLVKDELKNPCLDYVKYILFSREGFKFEVDGKSYSTAEEVQEAFLSGKMDEKVLKDVIIKEVNQLLEPVREHFRNDPTARDLLAKITQWKKENLTAPPGVARHVATQVVGSKNPVFVVFAPRPTEQVQLGAVLGVLRRLRQAPKGSLAVLVLEDWSAMTLGSVGGNPACIKGFYELLLFGLRSLAPELMKEVTALWQGALILQGPSEYWIAVINAGRRSNLETVRAALPPSDKLEYAGQVLAVLMHVGDVFALAGDAGATLCCSEQHHNMHKLAVEHCGSCSLPMPKVEEVADGSLRLMPSGEGVEADVNVMLTDKEVEVNRKVKKAFCQPQNVEFCPPLDWVEELMALHGNFLISRKPDNGGDKTYLDLAEMRQDFASGALHPGDLKAAFGKAMNSLLEPLREGLKTEEVLKRAQKDLEAYVKAQAKKK